MKLKKYGLLLASICMLASCSNDNPENPNGVQDEVKGEVYLTLDIRDGSTRAQGDSGTPTDEAGTTPDVIGNESKIESVLVILANSADTEVARSTGVLKDGKYEFAFSGTGFNYLKDNTSVKLYVVCNLPEASYIAASAAGGSHKPIQKILELAQDNDLYWGVNGFLMSNSVAFAKNDIDKDGIKNGKYTVDNPYYLGEVRVQRGMARLDLSKAQPTVDYNGVNIEFDGISLVNISKKFYLYKEVGNGSTFELFAPEMYDPTGDTGNYVNDPKTAWDADNLLNRAVEKSANSLTYNDTWFGTSSNSYDFWRYVTPNTVTDKAEQKNGKTTGIVFRAKINAATGSSLNVEAGETELYAYYGTFIGGLKYLQSINEYNQVYTNAISGKTSESDKKKALREAGFTIYPKEGDNFYCYYYYWIRHNGVGTSNDGVMHPMEFGVVRNNVYKIAVTKVSGLGKPGDYTPDPEGGNDPEKDPDPTTANITVSVTVDPWSLRIDNVEF